METPKVSTTKHLGVGEVRDRVWMKTGTSRKNVFVIVSSCNAV